MPDILGKVLGHALYAPTSRWPGLPPAIDTWLLRSCARMPHERFATAGEQAATLAEILRGASVSAVASAATMLPSPAYTPPQPYSQPPSYTPPHVTPYPHGTPNLANVGASTNEPLVHTHASAQTGMGTGAKVMIALFSVIVLLAGTAAIVVVLVLPKLADDKPSVTFAPPTTTAAEVATVVPLGSIEPLALSATSTATATTPRPHPTATVTATTTATATATHAISREQCRHNCDTACFDNSDRGTCLITCLRKTCPQ